MKEGRNDRSEGRTDRRTEVKEGGGDDERKDGRTEERK